MALFSCPISVVQRSAGQCAVSAAAYAARTKLNWHPRDKEINLKGTISWDYSHLPGLAYSKIHAPDGAPSWVFDREELWNKAEDAEIRHDAQTARKFIIALQVELTLEQNIALIEDIVSELVAMGMVVDTNIHTDKPHNPHAHLLATTRPLKENRYGEMEFSRLKTREWGSKDFIRATRAMVADKINDHLKLAGFDVRVTHESYKTLGIDLEPTRHEGPARNIKNSELVALNKEIYARNAEKIRENPSLVLDKLAINKPVFTKHEIAIEIEKVLSHEMIDTLETITNSSKKASKVSPDLESLNQDMTSKYMEIYTKIMRSPELSLVTGEDLKGRTLYTTTKRLEMEQRYVANVENLNNSNAHRLSLTESDLDQLSLKETIADATLKIVTDLAQALENKTGIKFSLPEQSRSLSDEQRAAVLNILNGPDIGVIEGIPGAGKTVAMQEIVRQSQKAGKTVIGVTPSSAAALVLGKETGIVCKNASLWRKEWLKAKGEKFDVILRGDYYKEDMYKGEGSTNILSGLFAPKGLTKDHVMIIDEASMMELAGMDYLLSEAARVGAKVIKVGDNNQLHAVGWLGAFKKTIDICGSHRLEEARRQQNPLHQRATKLLGSYKIRDALKIYLDEGSIIIEKGEAQSRAHLIKDYLESYIENSKILDRDDIATSRTQVISTYTNAAAAKLNVEVRRSLRDAGIIKGKQEQINVGDKKINLAKGEQIVFTRNYNHLGRAGIYNGEVGTVVSVSKPDEYGHSLVAIMVSKADGGKEGVIIDTKKHMKHGLSRLFDYGYAVTAHKLQGASVDLNFVHCETNMGYEAINVLFTRHRESLKLYANAEMLKDVLYASLYKDINKAKLRYDILGGEQILGGLVKLASRRVNSSFAGDYAGIGLSDNDKHLTSYIETVHKAVLLIREISSWQSQEYRRTGVKPDLWDHELWPEFQKTKTDRNEYALYITKNYPAFQDRIVQHSMNYATIEKHAKSQESGGVRNHTVIEEHHSILNLSEAYKMLVESINELDVRGISKVYRTIKSEIAANYEKVEKAISQRDELVDKDEELKSAIEAEGYYRDVLIHEYLSRIYSDTPTDVIAKYDALSEKHGAAKACAIAGNSAKVLGSLKGTGLGQILGFSKARKSALANSDTLEKSLLAYSRSNEIEKEYKMQLEQHNYGLQIQKLDEEIERSLNLNKRYSDLSCHVI